MGSKYRLVEWLHSILQQLDFDSACDAFSGSGVVSYLLKSMGKQVIANDSLHFPAVLSQALVQNNNTHLEDGDLERLLVSKAEGDAWQFIQKTFAGIFYDAADLQFLDNLWSGIREMPSPHKQSLALAAILRSCIKRQPRGVFTVAGDPQKYKDGRRDLKLSLREHFLEQVQCYNQAVFSNKQANQSRHGDVFSCPNQDIDLVYMDPPYVPRSDDNCYMKRYHFLEGLSCYWQGLELLQTSKVKKIKKPYTPFGHRAKAVEAFDQLFRHFADSTIVLSYSSNAYPDLDVLVALLKKTKPNVEVLRKPHRYHFGTHAAAKRNLVEEYLILGLA
ncbi:MAG: DNA adenine methylase [Verrucomicrobia bacterium]|nr:DNA adenine methylase [Verrucomicrobiota bacterium]